MIGAVDGLRLHPPVLNHFCERLVVKRPRCGTKDGGVGLRGVRYGFYVPLEGQDGTIGSRHQFGAI